MIGVRIGALGLVGLALLGFAVTAEARQSRRTFPEALEWCGLRGGGVLRQIGPDRYRLTLPPRMYAQRHGRLAGPIRCIDHWAHGADLEVRRGRR